MSIGGDLMVCVCVCVCVTVCASIFDASVCVCVCVCVCVDRYMEWVKCLDCITRFNSATGRVVLASSVWGAGVCVCQCVSMCVCVCVCVCLEYCTLESNWVVITLEWNIYVSWEMCVYTIHTHIVTYVYTMMHIRSYILCIFQKEEIQKEREARNSKF